MVAGTTVTMIQPKHRGYLLIWTRSGEEEFRDSSEIGAASI
jgi:hypothetical protein